MATDYRWLDLDGEGISGVLTEQDNSWFYKPNLGAAIWERGGNQSHPVRRRFPHPWTPATDGLWRVTAISIS